jgi:hypothetical protein
MFTFAIDRGAFATFGWEDANEAGRSKSVDLERVPELRMCAALTSYPHERWGVVRAPFFALRPARPTDGGPCCRPTARLRADNGGANRASHCASCDAGAGRH